MIIGLLTATLSIPSARSLKDKRSILRSLKDRVLDKMNMSVAEIGKQDLWKSAELAFVTVATNAKTVDQRLAEVSTLLQNHPNAILLDLHTQLI